MIFQDYQISYARDFLLANINDYPYYVLYSVTSFDGSLQPDMYIYMSKNPISASNQYTYLIPDNTLHIEIRSSEMNGKANKFSQGVYSSRTLYIGQYETVYSNANFNGSGLAAPDILATVNQQEFDFDKIQNGFNKLESTIIQNNDPILKLDSDIVNFNQHFNAVSLIILVILLGSVVVKLIKRG